MISWDERYNRSEYVYGTEPNDFLRQCAHHIPLGPVLCLCEGEGRNAVYLAGLGYDVTAVDASSVGLTKARRFADERQVPLKTVHANLQDFKIAPRHWQGIVSIFCHVPLQLRQRLHAEVLNGLVPGGVFVLEAYTPAQLQHGTGGPPTADLMMSAAELAEELDGTDLLIIRELERNIQEGLYHTGNGAVVQVLARRTQ